VKNLLLFTFLAAWFDSMMVLPTQAAFTSLYVFGDALSSTADSPVPASEYYQNRDSNGRVWVEVLTQRQGLTYDASKNNSYFDHNSSVLLTDVNKFKAPADVASDLFIVWVCNADIFDAVSAMNLNASSNNIYAQLQAANTASQANHLQIITQLYAKGVQTLVLPNAVDISTIPAFNGCFNPAYSHFVGVMHAACIDYNNKFSNMISQAMAQCPNLQIYSPDYFTLLNNVLANAPSYGLTNALYNGLSVDATEMHSFNKNFPPAVINGFGTNFIFWDPQDPTAMLHEIMADVAQQIISPVQINQLAVFNGSNRLDVVNYPAGLNGFVDVSTNLALGNWTGVTNIASSAIAQSFFVAASPLPPPVPPSGSGGSIDPNNPGDGTYSSPFSPGQFYRLRFPFAWSWP
jgi:phospholipase/lecithinase/hemolysin